MRGGGAAWKKNTSFFFLKLDLRMDPAQHRPARRVWEEGRAGVHHLGARGGSSDVLKKNRASSGLGGGNTFPGKRCSNFPIVLGGESKKFLLVSSAGAFVAHLRFPRFFFKKKIKRKTWHVILRTVWGFYSIKNFLKDPGPHRPAIWGRCRRPGQCVAKPTFWLPRG